MSTLVDASMTDPYEQTHHSESEMITIGDLAVGHQMPFLSVRRLTQHNCPRWSMWDSSNIARISKARTLDDTRDWYFPIIVKKEKIATEKAHPPFWRLANELEGVLSPLVVKDVWSSWSGIWHSSAQHTSERPRPLPPMTHLPHEWLHFSIPRDEVIASAGGLLLIKDRYGVVPIRRSKRLNPALADSNPSSISDTMKLADEWIRNRTPQSWKRLLVCNPLTRECRELPAANCRLLGLVSWKVAYQNGVQASLVVNEEANCYRVVLTLVEILECMGGLYAVLPAKIHDALLIGEEQPQDWKSEAPHCVDKFGRKLVFMPLCFYIMQLQGDGVDCGVLRIQVPLNQIDNQSRVLRLMAILSQKWFFFHNWFNCEARGSVIWVACEDYVLSFDVVSRESQTQIISLDDGTIHQFGEETLRFAYRPSLHMKP